MIKVALANIKDANKIALCAQNAYSDEIKKKFGDEKSNDYPTSNCVEKDIEKFTYYKIMLDDEIIGGVYLVFRNRETAIVEDFCIHPLYQNKGVGTKAYKQIEKLNSQVYKWLLCTPTYSEENQNFYSKLGYLATGKEFEDGIEVIKYEKNI